MKKIILSLFTILFMSSSGFALELEEQNLALKAEKEKSNAEHTIELNLGYTNRIFKKLIDDMSHEVPVNLAYRLTLPDNFTFWLDTLPVYLGTTTSKKDEPAEHFPFSVGAQMALFFGYSIDINQQWRLALGIGPGIGLGSLFYNEANLFHAVNLNFRFEATKMIDKNFGINIIVQDGVAFNRVSLKNTSAKQGKFASTIGNVFTFQFGFFFKVGGK